jgi:hypothetical protein
LEDTGARNARILKMMWNKKLARLERRREATSENATDVARRKKYISHL